MSRLEPPQLSRRSFLSIASLASFFAAMGTAVAGMLRLPSPAVLPGPVNRYKLGAPDEFPVGSETRFEKENVMLFHAPEGIYAISTVCTHLGCIVARSSDGFACPCHGSRFNHDGNVTGGPAPRPLVWLAVNRAADGQLVVNADKEVPAGTYYEV